METFRNPATGQFLPSSKPHNTGLRKYHDPQTGQVIYIDSDPGAPWLPGGGDQKPPNHSGSSWYHNPETGEKKRFQEDPGYPWNKGRGKTGTQTTNGMTWYHNPETGKGKLSITPPGSPWVKGGKPRGNPGWVEGVSRQHCRRWKCDSIYLLKMVDRNGNVFGKWGSSTKETFVGREREFKKKGITWEVLYWDWFGGETENVEASVGKKLSMFPAKGVPKFYGYTETFEWSEITQKLLKEIIHGLEKNSPS
jgi:hypothetical protein